MFQGDARKTRDVRTQRDTSLRCCAATPDYLRRREKETDVGQLVRLNVPAAGFPVLLSGFDRDNVDVGPGALDYLLDELTERDHLVRSLRQLLWRVIDVLVLSVGEWTPTFFARANVRDVRSRSVSRNQFGFRLNHRPHMEGGRFVVPCWAKDRNVCRNVDHRAHGLIEMITGVMEHSLRQHGPHPQQLGGSSAGVNRGDERSRRHEICVTSFHAFDNEALCIGSEAQRFGRTGRKNVGREEEKSNRTIWPVVILDQRT
jgi:hypothetical protein